MKIYIDFLSDSWSTFVGWKSPQVIYIVYIHTRTTTAPSSIYSIWMDVVSSLHMGGYYTICVGVIIIWNNTHEEHILYTCMITCIFCIKVKIYTHSRYSILTEIKLLIQRCVYGLEKFVLRNIYVLHGWDFAM